MVLAVHICDVIPFFYTHIQIDPADKNIKFARDKHQASTTFLKSMLIYKNT